MTDRPTLPAPSADSLAAAVAGLRAGQERLGAVVAMLEAGKGWPEVVTALVEVTRAVDRAGFAVISTGLRECVMDPDRGAVDVAAMEKLFLSLA